MNNKKLYPISKVNSNDTKIELNCRSLKAILLYFEGQYGREKLEEFIYDTKMNLGYLEDRNNWVSYDYFCRLLAKLIEYTGNPKAPFIAGTYAARKECFGAFGTFISKLGTPAGAYKLGAEFAARYTKIDTFNVTDLNRNNCTLALNFLDNYKQEKNNCINVQGIFASIPTLWGLPLAKVKEIQCATEGGDSCIYQFCWRNRPSYLFGLLGILGGLIFVYGIRAFSGIDMGTLMLMVIPIVGYLIGRIKDYKVTLKNSNDFNEKESKNLMESMETIEKLNIELQTKVEQRTEELQKALVDLKNSQNQLIQVEKMASIGRLAAGMAHELNNPVGAIRNYVQDILEEISDDNPLRERLKKTEKATDRCKRLVNDLLTFSRESKESKIVNINDIVEATISNAREENLSPNIRILKEFDPDSPKVKVDPLQIQQVFMNVIMNANDAIKREGQIVVKTSKVAENIYIEISDTGEGISQEIQDKIFDPFFTTKAPAEGKGLGLAISYNIIKRFNGDIQVKSEKDKGTTFTVILPVGSKIANSM